MKASRLQVLIKSVLGRGGRRFPRLRRRIASRVLFTAAVCAVMQLAGSVPAHAGQGGHGVTDHRGVAVHLPERIERVVTIDDGLIAGVMTVIGVADRIVGLGSSCIPKHWEFDYPAADGGSFHFRGGMNLLTCLNPGFLTLPLVAQSGTGINYEALAALRPDLVLLRVGDCTIGARDEKAEKTIHMIESLGIPLIVLFAPNTFEQPDLRTLSEEIRIIAQAFGKEPEGERLAAVLEHEVEAVRRRTEGILETGRPGVLLFGLSPKARDAGGAGNVRGLGTIDSQLLETYAGAKNAFREKGAWYVLSTEQVLALDPEVIVLITAYGYHPPQELYDAPYYRHLKDLKAVRNRRVLALPWTPCNCDKRLEYPIDVMVMAKAAYPERFEDVDLAEWILDFYQSVYGVDRETAKALRACQWMQWTEER
ncbi:ABC transporter substrate-binding protein [Desulfatiglans anilini]|uniref:ABC transporter substrate-binding protein n=1 Tax=Desulfatiglans anilini TaxID=90728 RepID=UPI000416F0B1|nr:ABC transporter substrate-binding protein [Desulfatiglans anilini]